MYKNQLQELAQRSCFNLPSYVCIREGPDHAPRFKAIVNFNGENFESPHYCTTLRQAEHAAAEVALNALSNRGPSHSLAARILDETGVYKNLLQEIAQRVGAPLPQYTTYRSGLGHQPVFTGTVELAGITFTGEPAKNKKQAEKNAALAAWSSLKQLAQQDASSSSESENNDEQEQIRIARALLNYRLKEKLEMAKSGNVSISFQKKFPIPTPRPSSPQRPAATTSKLLPLICPNTVTRYRSSSSTAINDSNSSFSQPMPQSQTSSSEGRAAPYMPVRPYRTPYRGIAPPVTIRTSVPVFSAPPRPQPTGCAPQMMQARPVRVAPPVCVRQAIPVFAAPPAKKETVAHATTPSRPLAQPEETVARATAPSRPLAQPEETGNNSGTEVDESTAMKCLEELSL
ncbi:double-stranded RNA-binding protein 2 [Nicotiana tabacum]|uniref:Double-stranded RNA-binding protein 2 n=1 Tax=Nicotiana tabacum TaxID=4097 RepID=A0A1S3Y9M2_TOBAC|nr:double-stranded RNA-binding protein 2-like [Nicotiana tomentosiformis]XP_016448779.1 PREDICTED: double-stranded RNA-binding protein 2-like [Nicotiana tabacum]